MNRHQSPAIGKLVRDWRQARRLSQLDLALEAEISQKHLSFIESGRSQPSREMVLRLAEHLEVPLRERNALLLGAGYAPVYAERSLDDPSLAAARSAIELVLKGHEPYPALLVDRYWTLLAANDACPPLMALAADPRLLEPPVNVLRLSLSPGGLAPHIVNFSEWREHGLSRLRQQARRTGDPKLAALHAELAELSEAPADGPGRSETEAPIALQLQLRVGEAVLSFISTTTVFGTPLDVTLADIALETFFPADAATDASLRRLSGS